MEITNEKAGKHKKEKKEKREKKESKKRHRDSRSSDSGSDDEEAKQVRANKKASKRAEKVAKILGYSNDTNPFGDSNLLQPFVWTKKQEKDTREGRDSTKDTEINRLKTMEEIERVRKRREDREKEMEEMERLRSEEQRLRDSAQFGDWQSKEEEFHMQQTRARSKIRIAESREQPIDLIAKNILLIESQLTTEQGKRQEYDLAGLHCELRDPSKVIFGLSSQDLEKLVVDIDSYLQLEMRRMGPYEQFWRSLRVVAEEEQRSMEHHSAGNAVHKSVADDVKKLLRGKTAEDLVQLQIEIGASIRSEKYADIDYWEKMLHAVNVQKAKLIITDTHQQLLQKQLEVLSRLRENAEIGGQSAAVIPLREASKDDDYQREFGESEERMQDNEEVNLPSIKYSWQDRFQPRKPRYFNRVRTGWDWNKYNQTHYDHDNPPPRTVQGYKFTVFYPDLIDKATTPKYFVEATDDKDFAILRLHAGPPYEDIAFKIINREWDINKRSGFKSVFDRGVLQLHFNFKRAFYRR